MSDYTPDFHPQKTLFQVGVKAIIKHLPSQQILILTRSEKVTNTNSTDLPGGNLENFESPLEGIAREILEETGLSCTNYKIVHLTTVNHHQQPLLIIGYTCETDSNQVTLDWENSAFAWLTQAEALNLDLPASHKDIIQKAFSP